MKYQNNYVLCIFVFLALQALSEFAQVSYSTFNMLFDDNNKLLDAWLSLLNVSKGELIAAALHSVCKIIELDESHQSMRLTQSSLTTESKTDKNTVVELKKLLFNRIGVIKGGSIDTITYLLKLAKMPVDSPRHAAVDLSISAAFCAFH